MIISWGSVILDELEREYTKELVRHCLAKNGHSSSPPNGATNGLQNVNGINTVDILSGNIDFERNKNGLTNNSTTATAASPENGLHSNGTSTNGFWSKMRKSPLFFIYRSTDSENSGTTV